MTAPAFGPRNPLSSRLLHSVELAKPGSPKQTKHFEISLMGSGMEYLPGDSLAVLPNNDPDLASAITETLGFSGEELVTSPRGDMSFHTALLQSCSLNEIDKKLIRAICEKDPTAAELEELLQPERKEQLNNYSWGRDILDVIQENSHISFEPQEFINTLKRLNIRLYSISSSLKANPDQVHLTVATVKYESRERTRKGVCSNWLADRINNLTEIPVFITPGKGFRLPDPDDDSPIIMCGPGTGIAPFRAFLQEREATNAKGDAWLFFGEVSQSTCFFYEDEWAAYLKSGVLSHLTTAWSRDQTHKIYVQDKMRQESRRLWEYLENGAYFYICGDANRMAPDVDRALHDIVENEGGKSPEEAAAYVLNLRQTKRYRRDVY